MATITSLTADAILAIQDATIVDASLDGSNHLILTTYGGTNIDVGSVIGPTGADGVSGAISVTALEDVPGGTPAGTPIFLKA
jgi:hypothetical protein